MTDPAAPVTPVTPAPAPAAATPPAATPTPAPAADPAAPAAPASPAPAEGDKTPPAKPDAPAADPAKPADPAAPKDPAAPVDPNAPKPDDKAEFKIPEEYKDRPWAAKIKSEADLFKQLDNLDKLAGKKAIPPDLAKATPEEREAFYAQLRPKDASEYVFADPKTVPLPPEVKTAVGEMFMKNGISATQGNEIIKTYQELGDAEMAKMFDPEGFKTAMTAAFGEKYQDYVGLTRNTLKGLVSEDDNKMLDNLPNAYASLVYRTLGNTAKAVQNLMAKYGVKETSMAHFADKTAGIAPVDIESERATLRGQITALSSRPHEAAERQALVDKLADTYKKDTRVKAG